MKNKMRIAVVTPISPNAGGSFQYVEAFINALASLPHSKYNIHVWHKQPKWEDSLTAMGIRSRLIDANESLAALKRFNDTLRNFQAGKTSEEELRKAHSLVSVSLTEQEVGALAPDIVIFPQMTENFTVPGAIHIGVVHDLMHRYEPQFPEVGNPQEVLHREALFNNILTQSDIVLVDSNIGAKHVRECYPDLVKEGQLQVLPYTAPEEILICTPKQPDWDVPEKFFFYPAQFWKHKNHTGLARAISKLVKKIPDIHVIAAGNTNQNGYDDFIKVLKARDVEKHFTMPGYTTTEELAWLYKHARALIMPTFFGPTNIPPLEAMALGCPVAVSGIYGMPESYGDAALYFDPKNISEMANVMEQLWTDDRLCVTLKKNGTCRADQYTIKNFTDKLQEIIETCSCVKL